MVYPKRTGYGSKSQDGVSAVIAVIYVLSIFSAISIVLVTVSPVLRDLKSPQVLGAVSVLLLQFSIPAAIYDGYQFSVVALIVDIAGLVVSAIVSVMILLELNKTCVEDSGIDECENLTTSLTPFVWATIWALSLSLAFVILFGFTCLKLYYLFYGTKKY